MKIILKNDAITNDNDTDLSIINDNDSSIVTDNDLSIVNYNHNYLADKNIILQNKLTMLYKENLKLRKKVMALQDLFCYELIAVSKNSSDKSS
jgi:hypothetical protein